jgi:hypothetical protein
VDYSMPRATVVSALLLLVLAVPAHPAEPPRSEGTIQLDDDTRVEVLGEKVPVGQRIDLPEGWYRVEEEGTEDGEVGSFTVASAAVANGAAPAEASTPPADAAVPEPAVSPAAFAVSAVNRPDACRSERTAYLRQLWRESGIDVSDPDALVRGLDAGGHGRVAAFLWSALSMDAVRNLAWSSELRSRAQDLIRCVNDQP